MLFRFNVSAEADGQRLDEFLASRISDLSRMRIARIVAEGSCSINGTAQHAGRRVREGDEIALEADAQLPSAMTPEDLPLDIVYEDSEIVVINKPVGVLVHPTRGIRTGTLANALTHHLNRNRLPISGYESSDQDLIPSSTGDFIRPGIVHRLDRATSGLLVIAKTQQALSRLATHFNRRLVEKRYHALVTGDVEKEMIHVSAPISRDNESRPEWNVRENGKPSETRLTVMLRGKAETLVELEPITGRTNQLRIHCAHIGHPIVGDEWYGKGAGHRARLCLHAARLGFHHPADNRWMEFETTTPFELEE